MIAHHLSDGDLGELQFDELRRAGEPQFGVLLRVVRAGLVVRATRVYAVFQRAPSAGSPGRSQLTQHLLLQLGRRP